MKTVVLFLLAGAALGLVVVDFVAPAAIAWDHTPRSGQALCNCGEIAASVSSALIKAQAIGAAVGGLACMVLGILYEVRQRKKTPPAATTAA